MYTVSPIARFAIDAGAAAVRVAVGCFMLSSVAIAQHVIDLGALTPAQGVRIDGVQALSGAGASVATVGDLNGDGLEDLAIGAPWTRAGLPPGGTLFVLFGRAGGFPPVVPLADLDGSQGFRVVSSPVPPNAYFGIGIVVAAAGDLNADGVDDLLVNSPGMVDAVVIFGGRNPFPAAININELDGRRGFRFAAGPQANALSGIAGGFDLNRDGIDDVAMAYPLASVDGVSDRGRVFVLFGRQSRFPGIVDGSSLSGADGFRIDGTATIGDLGAWMSNPGDVDDDGHDDLMLTSGGSDLYILHARSSPFPAAISAAEIVAYGGFSLGPLPAGIPAPTGLGDVNGDGIDDFALGLTVSPGEGVPNPNAFGLTYVVFGTAAPRPPRIDPAGFDGRNGVRIDGWHPHAQFGRRVSGLGDFNGDGIGDLVIGATNPPFELGPGLRGAVCVLYGRAGTWPARVELTTLPPSQGLLVVPGSAPGGIGFSVASAGDINQDGLQDVLIGSPGAARAYVVHGTALVAFADGFE